MQNYCLRRQTIMHSLFRWKHTYSMFSKAENPSLIKILLPQEEKKKRKKIYPSQGIHNTKHSILMTRGMAQSQDGDLESQLILWIPKAVTKQKPLNSQDHVGKSIKIRKLPETVK